jgi:hypothetical protein
MASTTSALYLWQRPWCPGKIPSRAAIDLDVCPCDVSYDDGDFEKDVHRILRAPLKDFGHYNAIVWCPQTS